MPLKGGGDAAQWAWSSTRVWPGSVGAVSLKGGVATQQEAWPEWKGGGASSEQGAWLRAAQSRRGFGIKGGAKANGWG